MSPKNWLILAVGGLSSRLLGIDALIGAQLSTRYLPKLPDKVVEFCFRTLLAILAIYFFWRAGNSY